jgi:predicted ATP-grasp superfamily ATP-dependent carboligase
MKGGPRILVTDAETRAVLAACRGLGAAGYRVSTVAEDHFAVGHWSRFSKERIRLAGPNADPEAFVERLSRVLRRGAYDLVIPGTERSLLPISERRDLIEPYARLGLPPHEIVLRTLDKPLLQTHAAAVGLTPPTSVVCTTAEEAVEAALGLTFPLIVKPAHSITMQAGRLIQHRKGIVVGDPTRLKRAVAEAGVPLTLQEYASGATIVSVAGVRADGRLLGPTVVRYIRTFPSRVGMAAMAVTIPPPPLLIQRLEALLELIGWQGIFELELLELGGERLGAIDLNPRPFGWMALAIGAGANLPALWCDHVLGRRSVRPDGARAGIHYRWEDAEIRNAFAQLRRRRFRSALEVLRPHRRVVHAHFRIDDPAPMVARMLTLARRLTSAG